MIFSRLIMLGPAFRGDRHHVAQQTVDAVADPDRLALRLDVDVAGAGADGVAEERVEQSDRRRLVGVVVVVVAVVVLDATAAARRRRRRRRSTRRV